MAISAREIYLVVRARDEASSTLRRVSGSLDRMRSLAQLDKTIATHQASLAALGGRINSLTNQRNVALKRQSELETAINDNEKIREELTAQINAATDITIAKTSDLNAQQDTINLLQKEQADVVKNTNLSFGRRMAILKDLRATEVEINAEMSRTADLVGEANINMKEFGTALGLAKKESASLNKELAATSTFIDNSALSIDGMTAAQVRLNEKIKEEQGLRTRTALENRARVFQGIGGFGKTAQFVGGAALVGLGFAANSAANFNTQVALVATQTGKSFRDIGKNVDYLRPKLLGLMTEFPIRAKDMTTAAYDIYSSLNVTLPQGVTLLKSFAKAAVAGQTDIHTATAGGITIMKDFHIGVNGINKALQEEFATVRFGRLTFTDFNNSLAQVVPSASAAHQQFGSMLGAISLLTRDIPSVSKATVGLARAYDLLGNTKLQDKLKSQGVIIKDSKGQLLDIATVIDRIRTKFPELKKGINLESWLKTESGQTGTIQARRALFFLLTDYAQLKNLTSKVKGDNIEFTRSYKALAESSAVQWHRFLGQLEVIWITLGQAVMPTFVQFGAVLVKVANYLNGLSPAAKNTLGQFLAMGAIFTFLGGSLLVVVGLMGGMVVNLARIGVELTDAAAAGSRLAGVFLAMGDAVGGLATAVPVLGGIAVAIGFAYLAWKGFTTPNAMQSYNARIDNIGKSWQGVKDSFHGILDAHKALDSARTNLERNTNAIHDYQKALENTKKGTDAYRSAQAKLNLADQERRMYLEQVTNAQQNYQKSLTEFPKSLKKLSADMQGFIGAEKLIQQSQSILATGPASKSRAWNITHIGDSKQSLEQQIGAQYQAGQAVSIGTKMLSFLTSHLPEYQTMLDKLNLNAFSASVVGATQNFLKLIELGNNMTGSQSGLLNKMAKGLRSIPSPKEFRMVDRFANAGDTNVVNAIMKIINLTHRMPKQTVINALWNGRDAEKKVLNFILLTHKIPTRKQINLWVGNADKVDRTLGGITRKVSAIRQEQHAHNDLGIDSTALDSAQKKLGAIDKAVKKKHTATIFMKTNPADLSQWGSGLGTITGQHIAAGIAKTQSKVRSTLSHTIAGNKDAVSAAAGTLADPLAQGIASKLATDGPGILNPAVQHLVDQAIKQAAISPKGLHTGSPSKKAAKLLGDPIIEGIIQGIFAKQTKLNDTLSSVLNNVLGIYSSFKSQFQGTLGTLFGGPQHPGIVEDALQFQLGIAGGKVTFGAVYGDLRTQVQQFQTFQRGLATLRRRGAPIALIQQLAAIGPSALPELNALLSATKGQDQAYFRLFNQGQTAISSEARKATYQQLNLWKTQGHAVALGFLTGLQDYSPMLDKWVKNFFMSLYNSVKNIHQSHSPSKLYYNEGVSVMQGFILGLAHGAGAKNLSFSNPRIVANVMVVHHKQEIHAHQDETYGATNRRAGFQYRQSLERMR